VRGPIACVFLLPLATGCAALTDKVNSSGGIAPGSAVMFAEAAPGDDLASRFHAEVSRRLAERGHSIVATADLALELAVAVRDPEVAFATGAQLPASGAGGGFALCDRHVLRTSIAIVDRRSGQIAYRGAAQELGCGAISDDDVANQVTQALAGLHSR
jgi:hypothetical protein